MQALRNLWNKLNGNKTYLGAIAYGLLGILWSQGVISDSLAGTIAALVTTWTGFAVRDAIGKAQSK